MGEISSDGESIFAERGANPKEAAVPPRDERQTAGAIPLLCTVPEENMPVESTGTVSETQRRLSKANFKLSAVIWRDGEKQRNEREEHATRRALCPG